MNSTRFAFISVHLFFNHLRQTFYIWLVVTLVLLLRTLDLDASGRSLSLSFWFAQRPRYFFTVEEDYAVGFNVGMCLFSAKVEGDPDLPGATDFVFWALVVALGGYEAADTSASNSGRAVVKGGGRRDNGLGFLHPTLLFLGLQRVFCC